MSGVSVPITVRLALVSKHGSLSRRMSLVLLIPARFTESIFAKIAFMGSRFFLDELRMISHEIDLKRINRAMKRTFNCASTLKTGEDDEQIIQLQGDHRIDVKEWLIVNEVLTAKEAEERIVVHGG